MGLIKFLNEFRIPDYWAIMSRMAPLLGPGVYKVKRRIFDISADFLVQTFKKIVFTSCFLNCLS